MGKEGLSDGDVLDLGQVEQPTVGSSVQVDSVFVLAEGVNQEHREEDPETVDGERV